MRYTIQETFGINEEYTHARYGIWDIISNSFTSSPTGIGLMIFLSESYAEEVCKNLNSNNI